MLPQKRPAPLGSGFSEPLAESQGCDGQDEPSPGTPDCISALARQHGGCAGNESPCESPSPMTDDMDEDCDCDCDHTNEAGDQDQESDTDSCDLLEEPVEDVLREASAKEAGRAASVAERQALKAGWPDGPAEYTQLFEWPQRYAKILLADAEHQQNLIELLTRGISHHDAYSGLGTASMCGKCSLDALRKELLKLRRGQARVS